jgi:integrase
MPRLSPKQIRLRLTRLERERRSQLTANNVVALYLRHCRSEHVHCDQAGKTVERTLALFLAHVDATDGLPVADLPYTKLRRYHFTGFIEAHPEWKSQNTRYHRASMVKACFSWAAGEERIHRDPFAKVVFAQGERAPETTDDVLSTLCRHANKRAEPPLRFIRLTGCRVTEMCRAKWPTDLDLDRGLWTIRVHKGRKHTKKDKVVTLVPEAVALVREVLKLHPPEYRGPLFLNTRGRPWTKDSMGLYIRKLCRRLGITAPARIHGIRHRFATAAIVNGAPIKLVGQQMGISSIKTLEKHYLHLGEDPEAIRAAAKMATPKTL